MEVEQMLQRSVEQQRKHLKATKAYKKKRDKLCKIIMITSLVIIVCLAFTPTRAFILMMLFGNRSAFSWIGFATYVLFEVHRR